MPAVSKVLVSGVSAPGPAVSGVVLCLAYCLGLFAVSLLVRHIGLALLPGTFISGLGLLALGVGAAVWMPRWWRLGPRAPIWLLAGLLALLASFNYCWRWPVPTVRDISQVLSRGESAGAEQTVWGTVQDTPRQNRGGRGRFWLEVDQVRSLDAAGEPLGKPESVS
ncbi:MAG TPA: DUF4131 domain-containing protein, partial [Trichocoleus sp.]